MDMDFPISLYNYHYPSNLASCAMDPIQEMYTTTTTTRMYPTAQSPSGMFMCPFWDEEQKMYAFSSGTTAAIYHEEDSDQYRNSIPAPMATKEAQYETLPADMFSSPLPPPPPPLSSSILSSSSSSPSPPRKLSIAKNVKKEHNSVSSTSTSVTYERRKERTLFNKSQVADLERRFQVCQYLNRLERYEMSVLLGLTERQIKVWFQNRRMKKRRDSDELAGSSLTKQDR